MKVYYAANIRASSGKAHAIQFFKMAEALSDEVDLTLVLPRKGKNADLLQLYGMRKKIPIVFLPVVDLFGGSRFGFSLAAATFSASQLLFFAWQKLRRIRFFIYTIDLDQFSYFFLPVIAPTFIEVHGSKRRTFFTRFFFKRVSGIVAVSGAVRDALCRAFSISATPSLVAPNGIDLESFRLGITKADAKQRLGFLEGRIFLYNGRIYDWKGLETLVQAARSAPRAVIKIVGGERADLEKLAGPVPENIDCLGAKPFADMPLYLAAADFFLLTATAKNRYSFYETSPMKLFEYMAVGRPVIAARTPSVEEIVSDAEVLFYRPDDPKDLAEKLAYALEHEAELQARAANLARKAQAYSWRNRAKAVAAFIQHSQ